MSQLTKSIQIFKAGEHTPTQGSAISFAPADLIASANAYDINLHEAPLVIGHPSHDAPAYGWVRELSFDGEDLALNIVPDQINPDFAEMHKAGSFKKRSASFYHPSASNNPVPGVYYLKHVGFLGATPPAIKGLKSAEFTENEEGIVTVEFGESENRWAFSSINQLFRNLRDFLIEKHGRDEANNLIPEYAISEIEEATKQDKNQDLTETNNFNEPQSQQENDMTEAEKLALQQREDDLKTREQKLEFAELQREHIDYVAKQVTAGQITPADSAGVVAFMTSLAQNTADTLVEFGEGEAKQTIDPVSWFKSFVESSAKRIDFTEHSSASDDDQHQAINFASPQGYAVDEEQLQLHAKIEAYAKKHNTDYATAATNF